MISTIINAIIFVGLYGLAWALGFSMGYQRATKTCTDKLRALRVEMERAELDRQMDHGRRVAHFLNQAIDQDEQEYKPPTRH